MPLESAPVARAGGSAGAVGVGEPVPDGEGEPVPDGVGEPVQDGVGKPVPDGVRVLAAEGVPVLVLEGAHAEAPCGAPGHGRQSATNTFPVPALYVPTGQGYLHPSPLGIVPCVPGHTYPAGQFKALME